MNFYNMTDSERQILINQYEILKKGNRNKQQVSYFNSQIEYLNSGSIYLFKTNLNNLEPIINEEDSILVMDILGLHDVILLNAKKYGVNVDKLSFDFNNDHPYWSFAIDVIKSNLFPAYNNFEVIDNHGVKNIEDHKKQVNWWKNNENKPNLTLDEFNTILDYHKLP